MSQPNRNNPYSFNSFLEWRNGFNYYDDDLFLQKVVKHYSGDDWDIVDSDVRKISHKVSFRWKEMANAIAIHEKRPFMEHYDAHNNRIDRIVRPHETEVVEKEIFSDGMFSSSTSPWVKFLKYYLISQNGEAGIACPLACTDGMVELLKVYADSDETRHVLQHCSEGIDGDFGIGAQYLSEIQGGSDVPANLLEAVKEGDVWRLYGQKFFCSAVHADYSVVTAKPVGTEKVAIFIVPSWLPGNKEKEIRNGYTIDRIKRKLGTCELPTAEITYNGAEAYMVGPPERGIAIVTGIVLSHSRLLVGLTSACGMMKNAREAKKYSEFRTTFGMHLNQYPLVTGQVRKLENYARRTLSGAFKIYKSFIELDGGLQNGLRADEPMEIKKKRFDVRELILLQKIVSSWDMTEMTRLAMSVFGGNGVMEDFSSIPRGFRDGVINEQWEGPRNVLLTQIHRDFQRVTEWYSPEEFTANILKGADPDLIHSYATELAEFISYGNIFEMSEEIIEICERWDEFCQRLFHAYQDVALAEVESSDKL